MTTSTLTILFADMVGSSRRMARLGDDPGDDHMARFVATLDEVAVRHGGRTIKHLGDGVMAVFDRSALDAIRASRTMHVEAVRLDPEDPPLVRVGISLGDVTERADDYCGRAVVEAARLCDAADAGTTLVSPQVRSAIGNRDGIAFVDVGPLALKGLPAPMIAGRLVDSQSTAGSSSSAVPARTRRIPVARLAVAAFAALSLALGATWAFSGSSEDPAPPRAGTDRASVLAAPTDYQPVLIPGTCQSGRSPDVTCSTLRVPEDRAKPTGRTVDIPVTDVAATSQGAPEGEPVVEIGSVDIPETSPLRAHHRVISLGERGTVGTPILNCPEIVSAGLANLGRPILAPESRVLTLDAVQACRVRWSAAGVDVSAYDNVDIALDLRDLLVALGLDRIDLWVEGTRTSVAFSALRTFPGNIHALVLENPVPTDVSPGDFTQAFAAAFRRVGAQCDAQPRCHALNPDLDGAWQKAFALLQANPPPVTGKLPGGEETTVLLDGDRVASALFTATGHRHLQVFLPDLLTRPSLQEVAYNAREVSDVVDLPYGATLSDVCQRVAPNARAADQASTVIERLPQFRSHAFRLLPESCERWNVPAAAADFYETTRSDVPALIVHGELSPATDIDWVERVAKGFSTASVVRLPTLGFGPFDKGPRCLGELRETFLASPSGALDPRDVQACVESVPPIPFVVG